MSTSEEKQARAKQLYENALGSRLADTKEISGSSGPNSSDFQDCQSNFHDAKVEFDSNKQELHDRYPNIHFENPWFFWIPATLIFIIEASVNKIIIDMAAQTPAALSFLISAVISAILVAVSHLAGISWRQIWSELDRKIVGFSLGLGVILVLILLASVSGLMSVRAYYALTDQSTNMNIFGGVLRLV